MTITRISFRSKQIMGLQLMICRHSLFIRPYLKASFQRLILTHFNAFLKAGKKRKLFITIGDLYHLKRRSMKFWDHTVRPLSLDTVVVSENTIKYKTDNIFQIFLIQSVPGSDHLNACKDFHPHISFTIEESLNGKLTYLDFLVFVAKGRSLPHYMLCPCTHEM